MLSCCGYGCGRLCGRRRRHTLKPVFYSVCAVVCVLVLIRAFFHHHHVWVWLKLCGHRRQSVPGDINVEHEAVGRSEQLNLNMQTQSVCGGFGVFRESLTFS